MDVNRVGGSLMCSGSVVGLVGTTPNFYLFPFALMGYTSFLLVLLFGVVLLRKRPTGRRLGLAGLVFSSVGGVASVGLIWFGRTSFLHADLAVLLGAVGLVGTALALTGAAVKCMDARD